MKEREIKILEKYLKAIANATRLKVIFILEKDPGLSLKDVSRVAKCNLKTVSEHLRRLCDAKIVEKRINGRVVNHYLTDSGIKIIKMAKNYLT